MYASCQSEPLLLEKHQDERFCREGEVEDDYRVHRGDDDDGDVMMMMMMILFIGEMVPLMTSSEI